MVKSGSCLVHPAMTCLLNLHEDLPLLPLLLPPLLLLLLPLLPPLLLLLLLLSRQLLLLPLLATEKRHFSMHASDVRGSLILYELNWSLLGTSSAVPFTLAHRSN